MTLPAEKSHAIRSTRAFLRALMDRNETPRVPMEIRERARQLLKHFPGEYDMSQAVKLAPKVFG